LSVGFRGKAGWFLWGLDAQMLTPGVTKSSNK
jgi:hypothetical protein